MTKRVTVRCSDLWRESMQDQAEEVNLPMSLFIREAARIGAPILKERLKTNENVRNEIQGE